MNGIYTIREVSKAQACAFLTNHHYLSQLGNGLISICNIGCFDSDNSLCGVVCFNHISSPETLVGAFGLPRDADQSKYMELVRLSMDDQKKERNLTSWFVAKSIKYIRKKYNPNALLSYADSAYHVGYIYQATNWKYYGLTAQKKDFVVEGKIQQRGKTKGIKGEWIKRTRKHRYAMVFRGNTIKWNQCHYPKGQNNEMHLGGKVAQGFLNI